VVFKLSPSGTETVLYTFTGGIDGGGPFAGLIADSAGNLYGTTVSGGVGNGVVFKLSPSGTETVLYSFTGGSDGGQPFAGLIADSAGNLYGTTNSGGLGNNGVVLKLAGTGFVTAVPFLAFNAKLKIDLDRKPNKDSFELESHFTLSSTAPGINPVTEPVTLQVGTFTVTIPPGSFKKHEDEDEHEHEDGFFTFHGVIDGVRLEALIKRTGTLRYAFHAEGKGANLTGTVNPVQVMLTIGGDSGATSVKADIDH
jgi:uncharacterized repeat protein (TIGR03803 family)